MHKFLLFIIAVIVCFTANAKEIVVKSSHDFNVGLNNDYSTFRIKQKIDLNGNSVVLPQNTILLFEEGGSLQNGSLEGNLTKVKSSRHQIFCEDIRLKGTWNNTNVYGEWVGLCEDKPNNESFSNLTTLCNGGSYTHLYTPKGIYPVEAVVYSAPILLPSNVYWHNLSTIKLKGCDLTHFSIVLLHNVHNVTIDGGKFIGDVREHLGKDGEWGHGIKCGGATKVLLKNLECSYCWGDGIDLIEGRDSKNEPTINCDNIKIHNVKCLHNRRQGMSIEAAHHVKVSDCEFAYTGIPRMAKPAAGLDIEEWKSDGHKMNYLTFKNCSFHDNVGFDMQSEPNWKMGNEEYIRFENNILFDNCAMDSCRVTYTNGIAFNNCVIKDINVHHSNNVNFTRCTIEKYAQSKNKVMPKIKKCKGKAVLLSYVLPVSVVGVTSVLGLGCLVYNETNNEKRRHNHYS